MQQTQPADACRRDAQCIHCSISHLSWCPRRHGPVQLGPVQLGPVAARCRDRELIEGTYAERGWETVATASRPDHLHLFARAWPSASAADVIKECTGLTAHQVSDEFPRLRSLP